MAEAIATCRRAREELSLLDDEEGTGEPARDQMRLVWRRLEEGIKRPPRHVIAGAARSS